MAIAITAVLFTAEPAYYPVLIPLVTKVVLPIAIESIRRRKFDPCWGVFAYQLVDPLPGIGFGLLDHELDDQHYAVMTGD